MGNDKKRLIKKFLFYLGKRAINTVREKMTNTIGQVSCMEGGNI